MARIIPRASAIRPRRAEIPPAMLISARDIARIFRREKIRKRSAPVGRPATATNDEQQNVDRNYAVINLGTYTRETPARTLPCACTDVSVSPWTGARKHVASASASPSAHTDNKNTRTPCQTHTYHRRRTMRRASQVVGDFCI